MDCVFSRVDACAAILSILFCSCAEDALKRHRPENYFDDTKVIELCLAIEQNDLKKIDRLVAVGANVNAKGKKGVNPLSWALLAKQKQAFERLLKHKADPNQQDGDGEPAICLAALAAKDSDWLEMALKHGGNPDLVNPKDGNPVIFNAIKSRNKTNLRLIIKAGANLNCQHSEMLGMTPLIYAAGMNWFDSALILLEAGADHTIRTKTGHSVTDAIIDTKIDPNSELGRSKVKVLKFLEDKGVKIRK